ncbi:hypothetical protein ANO11243_096120 [Dothideomycetidae sp. 11243]|nr:hypothetical protein ANO11243_096120 [fungal sp. No.11243]
MVVASTRMHRRRVPYPSFDGILENFATSDSGSARLSSLHALCTRLSGSLGKWRINLASVDRGSNLDVTCPACPRAQSRIVPPANQHPLHRGPGTTAPPAARSHIRGVPSSQATSSVVGAIFDRDFLPMGPKRRGYLRAA